MRGLAYLGHAPWCYEELGAGSGLEKMYPLIPIDIFQK
jgi:hypothetical protein